MTELFSAASAGLSLICAVASALSVLVARRERASLVRSLQSAQSQLRSLSTLQTEMQELLEALANKVKMQRVRNVVAHSAGAEKMPDPYKEPDAWRRAMQAKLSGAKLSRE